MLVTDLLHLFSENPLEPALYDPAPKVPVAMPGAIQWLAHPAGGGIGDAAHVRLAWTSTSTAKARATPRC